MAIAQGSSERNISAVVSREELSFLESSGCDACTHFGIAIRSRVGIFSSKNGFMRNIFLEETEEKGCM